MVADSNLGMNYTVNPEFTLSLNSKYMNLFFDFLACIFCVRRYCMFRYINVSALLNVGFPLERNHGEQDSPSSAPFPRIMEVLL